VANGATPQWTAPGTSIGGSLIIQLPGVRPLQALLTPQKVGSVSPKSHEHVMFNASSISRAALYRLKYTAGPGTRAAPPPPGSSPSRGQLEVAGPGDEVLQLQRPRVHRLHDAALRVAHAAALVVVVQEAAAQAAHLRPRGWDRRRVRGNTHDAALVVVAQEAAAQAAHLRPQGSGYPYGEVAQGWVLGEGGG